ncbi:MFS transporter [Pseudomonas sp. NPDC089534]|uniref:MFS transporter n=1 Tax=Pseudomonas sp. NPDC089534 TaxID=3364468 RepID=UPI00381A0D65
MDRPTRKERLCVLAAICLAALVLPLSFTAGAVATPAIGREYNAAPAALAWITNAFMLSFGSLLMAAGVLADRYGRKRLFTSGLSLFVAVSALLANATGIVALDALRALQGVAAAAALASGSAALAQAFEGYARVRAFSLLGTTFGVGLTFGPLLCGALVEQFGWRSIFTVTASLAGVSLVAAATCMRESANPNAGTLDVPGVISFSGMLTLLTGAIILGPRSGWHSLPVLSALAGAVICLAVFVAVELQGKNPMLNLRLFRQPRFVGVQILPVGTCYCYIVLIVLLPLRLIGVEGATPLHSGLILLALSAPMLAVPLLAAQLNRRVGAGTLCAGGFLLAAAGLLFLGQLDLRDPVSLSLCLLVIGTGTGLPWGLMDGLALSVVPVEQAGMAAGIFNTTRVAGEGIALAATLAVLTALVDGNLAHQLPADLRNEWAQRLVMGDLGQAEGPLRALLLVAYKEGFATLTRMLAAVTVVAAGASLLLLKRSGRDRGRSSSEPAPPARSLG